MKTTPSFTAYLLTQTERPGPVGDLARDVSEDRDWPVHGRTFDDFETYLYKRGACAAAINTLYDVWDLYQSAVHLSAESPKGRQS